MLLLIDGLVMILTCVSIVHTYACMTTTTPTGPIVLQYMELYLILSFSLTTLYNLRQPCYKVVLQFHIHTCHNVLQWLSQCNNKVVNEIVNENEILSFCMGLYTVYVKSFKGENFYDFCRFLLTANVLSLKIFLEYQLCPLTIQSTVPAGLKFSKAKVFPTCIKF